MFVWDGSGLVVAVKVKTHIIRGRGTLELGNKCPELSDGFIGHFYAFFPCSNLKTTPEIRPP